MTTLEHTFPFASIYEDVSKLFVRSGTSYTPVYLVNYAGPWGEEYVWTNHDVPNDPKFVVAYFKFRALHLQVPLVD